MQVTQQDQNIEFRVGDALAGTYRLDDRFKPHFCALRTPAGHNVTLVSPGDHRHHKGLMYALKCEDLNFWEEEPGTGHCGIQEIKSTQLQENGFTQNLLWREEGGQLATYDEQRTITCTPDPAQNGYLWTWETQRTALREHRLVKSGWTLDLEDGRKINYHGLGIRLPWMWAYGGPDFGSIVAGDTPLTDREASGRHDANLGMWGVIDGCWERTKARVTIRQEHGFAWFALNSGFAYLSTGPTIEEELEVRRGQTFTETYTVLIQDLPTP